MNKESRSRKGDPQRIKSTLTVMNEEQKNEHKMMDNTRAVRHTCGCADSNTAARGSN